MLSDAKSRRAVLVLSAVALVAGAGPVSATTVIGAGNSAHDNTCTNASGPRPTAATARSGGVLQALGAAVPLTAPANQCGDLGAPKEDKADQPAENFHVDVAE